MNIKIRTLAKGIALIYGCALTSVAIANPTPVPPAGQICVTCHGAEGEGIEPLGPRLAGLSKEYISTQLQHFQAGVRQNATMMPMAMTLQGDGIDQVASYFSAKSPKTEVKPVIRGEQVTFSDDTARLA